MHKNSDIGVQFCLKTFYVFEHEHKNVFNHRIFFGVRNSSKPSPNHSFILTACLGRTAIIERNFSVISSLSLSVVVLVKMAAASLAEGH